MSAKREYMPRPLINRSIFLYKAILLGCLFEVEVTGGEMEERCMVVTGEEMYSGGPQRRLVLLKRRLAVDL